MSSFRARVIAVHKTRWELRPEDASPVEAILGPRCDPPVVGDWVEATMNASDTIARVIRIEPRHSLLIRKRPGDIAHDAVVDQLIAANIDVALLAMCDDDFSVRRLERYLTLAWDSGATPAVVITKADLVSQDVLEVMRDEISAVTFGTPIITTSATTGAGIDQLREMLTPGSCAILLGSSGVGKSSLVNALSGSPVQAVSGVRAFDGRGRHTTTSRRLVELPWGAYLVDTPGLRELQIWGDEDSLTATFADVETFAADCRFDDCAHDTEPGCAVRQALEDGDLPQERFVAWQRLHRELAYLARKTDTGAARAERARWKSISKQHKAIRRGK